MLKVGGRVEVCVMNFGLMDLPPMLGGGLYAITACNHLFSLFVGTRVDHLLKSCKAVGIMSLRVSFSSAFVVRIGTLRKVVGRGVRTQGQYPLD